MFGKSVNIRQFDGPNILVWAVYEGRESDGTRGKEPVAWFLRREDALKFIGEIKL